MDLTIKCIGMGRVKEGKIKGGTRTGRGLKLTSNQLVHSLDNLMNSK